MLLSTTAWVSVLSVSDSMHDLRRQRMHGHQFAARFLVGRGCRCWRRAVKSVMECWWPAWAGWWCSLAPDQSGPCRTRINIRGKHWLYTSQSQTLRGITGELKTTRSHMMPPPLRVCNRLPSSADAANTVKFVKSFATRQHRFYVDMNFLTYPAPLSTVQFRPNCNQFICCW